MNHEKQNSKDEQVERKMISVGDIPGVLPEISSVAHAPVEHGKVISIAPEDFRGDPSRVIGHPSNTSSEVAQAYSESLSQQQPRGQE